MRGETKVGNRWVRFEGEELAAPRTTAATAREGNGQTQLPDRDIGWVPDRPLVLSTHGLRKVYDLPAVDGITAWTSTWPEHLRSKRP